MSSPASISDSQSDTEGVILDWRYIERLKEERREEALVKKQKHILKDLQPLTYDFAKLPTRRTRDYGFCQRHIYTADLSEYLSLASRYELDQLSKSRHLSDNTILHMLNRKYTKLRKFYGSLGVKRHRFKKKSFEAYLDDFKKYQTGRDGQSFYEMQDQALDDSRDQRHLLELLQVSLEDVETTDEEEDDEEKVNEEAEEDKAIVEANDLSSLEISSNPSTVNPASPIILEDGGDDASQQVIFTTDRGRGRVIEESLPVSPQGNDPPITANELEIRETDNISDTPSSHAPVPVTSEVSRRTRRHNFLQDHVYVTDTAIHLGLATAYFLNDMYEEGKSYDDIVNFLETIYRRKRDERKAKEVGLGPYSKPTFRSYLDDENRHLMEEERHLIIGQNEREDSLRGFLDVDDRNFNTSDEDYVFHDDRDDVTTSLPAADSQGSGVFEIPSDSGSDNDNVPLQASEDFVFRNRQLNRKNALHGVLPNSFYRIERTPHTRTYRSTSSRRTNYEGPLLPGIARRKKIVHRQSSATNEEMRLFLASDADSPDKQEANPADYHRLESTLCKAPNDGASVFDVPSSDSSVDGLSSDSDRLSAVERSPIGESEKKDDRITIDDYDMFIDEMREGMDMYGSAEEDSHTGVNYMLSKGSGSSRKSVKSRKRTNRSLGTRMSTKRSRVSLPGIRRGVRRAPTHSRPRHPRRSRTPYFAAHPATRASPLYSKREVIWLSDGDEDKRPAEGIHRNNEGELPVFSDISNLSYRVRAPDKSSDPQPPRIASAPPSSKKDRQPVRKEVGSWNVSKLRDVFYFGRNKVNGTPQIEGNLPADPNGNTAEDKRRDHHITSIRGGDIFAQTVHRLDHTVSDLRDTTFNLDDITLQAYKRLQLRPNAVVYSNLVRECLKLDGDYFKEGEMILEYSTVRFSVSSCGPFTELPGLMETLFEAIQLSLTEVKTFTRKHLVQLRKSLIRVTQLLWNLKHADINILKAIGKLVLKFIGDGLDGLKSHKLQLLCLPYQLMLLDLMHKFMRQLRDPEYQDYERWFSAVEKAYITAFCSLPSSKVYSYLKGAESGGDSFFLESGTLFLSLSANPWQYVAELSKIKHFKLHNVFNFLYFVHSRIPVVVDWEYFIHEMDNLRTETNPEKWKLVFYSLLRVIQDLSWTFEEDLLVKMYRLLSYSRFENVGSKRPAVLWYSSLPASTLFLKRDGCLDMYLKFLVLYVKSYLDPTRQSNLMEKLVPIAAVKTSTITLLKNRANVMLVMSYLFKRDFGGHFSVIFKALLEFRNAEAYRTTIELLLVLSRCYFSQFQKLPLGIIKRALPQVVSAINNDEISISVVAESLRNLVDCFENQLGDGIDDRGKLIQAIDLACILLKLEKVDSASRVSYVPNSILATLNKVLEMTDSKIFFSIESKLKNELLGSLKSVILSASVNNDPLKVKCLSLWIYLSSRLNVTAGSLTYIEWQYFGDKAVRTKFELPFYTSLLKYYRPVDLRYLHDNLFAILMSNLPLLINPFFYSFFVALAEQEFMNKYVSFRSGLNASRFSAQDLKNYREQLSVKILARLVMELKKSGADDKYRGFLTLYIKALEKEYSYQKRIGADLTTYNQYATRIVRYLYTVVGDMIKDLPEFVVLKRELSITQILSSLSEQLESVSSTSELYLLLESEYISSLERDNFEQFKSELVTYCVENDGFIDDEERVSPIVPLSTLLASHLGLILGDRKFWIHLANWFSIFTDLVCKKRSFVKSEVWHIVKLLTLLTRISGTGNFPYNYYEISVTKNAYIIIGQLSLFLLGFEDRLDFIRSIDVIRGVDAQVDLPIDRDLFISLSSTDLDKQVGKIYADHNLVLSRTLHPISNPSLLASISQERAEVSSSVMGLITNSEPPVDVPGVNRDSTLIESFQFI
ncbi:DEKNAAC101771 [Brettanomyces naardenensis]|uniref:DEKNAAC101771 n=1 Tax=Brettanomyces naardenensis TaxID=13370 RepID=A0A448YIN4_BRENA|nr:DEKNAAC101771 [Brettanomyces naardenensis]